MTTDPTAVWLILAGAPITIVLWTSTSRAPTSRPVDRTAVAAVAMACTATVVTRPGVPAAVALPLAVAGTAAACVDAREGRLPDALTVPLLPVTLAAVAAGTGGVTATGAALLAAVLGLVAALSVHIVSHALLGWGDVKLAPTLAVVVSQGGSPAVFASVAAVGVALTALLCRSATGPGGPDEQGVVPYGPALVVGALCSAAAG